MSNNAGNSFTEIKNPASGEVIGKSPLTPSDEIAEIITKARKTQKTWGSLPLSKRKKYLRNVKELLVEKGEEIASVISKDNGKTRIEAMATEVLPASMAISYYCRKAKKFLKDKGTGTGNIFLINKRSKLVRVPFGVVGIISPWNYPFAIPFSEVVMALLSGNCVILKTASETQLTGQKLNELFSAAGLPDGVFTYINLPGKICGDLLLENGIDKLFFTGSVEAGKYLMKKAGETLTPIVLELGGNDPMIVCEDADPYRAAMGALWAGFQNAGQSCGGVERIYVHEKIYPEFMSVLKEKIDGLRIGNGDDFNSQMGCITTEKQAVSIQKHINEAIEKGAVVFAKSVLPDGLNGNFMPAYVLTNVNHDMLVMKEETFGPVVGVMKFSNYDEAISLANDSHLGLTASVWSGNKKFAEKLARKIEAGAVTINDHLMSHGLAETPWGGFKQSGIGKTHGESGFNEMSHQKVVVYDIAGFLKKNLWWHPYNEKVYNGLASIITLLYSRKIMPKFKAIKKLMSILPRVISKKD